MYNLTCRCSASSDEMFIILFHHSVEQCKAKQTICGGRYELYFGEEGVPKDEV